jgi:hypothetical protein
MISDAHLFASTGLKASEDSGLTSKIKEFGTYIANKKKGS